MEKNVFLTKTGIAAIAGFVVLLFGLFGINVEASELEKIITAAAGLITAVGVLYGRVKANQKAVVGKPETNTTKAASILLLCGVVLSASMLSGCALKEMKPYEAASSVSYELMGAYLKAHDSYLETYNEASPELQAMLRKDVAPYYNNVKSVLIELGDLSQTWRLTQEKPGDWDALLAKAQEMVPRLAVKLSDALKEFKK